MTAATEAAPRAAAPQAPISWRRLLWVTYRQHRTMLAWVLGGYALFAVGLLPSGLAAHAYRYQERGPVHLYGYTHLMGLGQIFFQLLPLAGGLFLGAPLLARETEHGTVALAWTQGADRSRWLLAKVIPIGALLALLSLGLGYELRWWATTSTPWTWVNGWSVWFTLNPVPLAGWTLLSFALGVLTGALTRRTLGGIGGLIGGYLALLVVTASYLRLRYLPPLTKMLPLNGNDGGFFGSGVSLVAGQTRPLVTGPEFVSQTLAWPDGRTCDCWSRSQHWMTRNHLGLLTYYQPASRYQVLTYLEGGWLAVLAVLLLAATVLLIRRRSA